MAIICVSLAILAEAAAAIRAEGTERVSVQSVMARELEVIRAQLKRNNVTLLCGSAAFAGPQCVEITLGETVTRVFQVLQARGALDRQAEARASAL